MGPEMEGYEEGVSETKPPEACERQIAASTSSSASSLHLCLEGCKFLLSPVRRPFLHTVIQLVFRSREKPAQLRQRRRIKWGKRDGDDNDDKRHDGLFLYYSSGS